MSYTLNYTGSEIDDILDRAAPGGAIDQALATKQDALTFDAVPTEGSTNPAESGGIYDAIQAGGAAALAAFATDSVSGDVVSFPDGADGIPVKAFTGSIIPSQNLNGQSAPYPAGGGKNKLNYDSAYSAQKTGENAFSGSNSTINGIRIPVPSACVGQACTFSVYVTVPSSPTYVVVKANVNGTDIPGNRVNASSSGYTYVTFTPTSTSDTVWISYGSGSGTIVFKDVQLEIGSSRTAWVPYSNICPISGWTGANITRLGKNLFNVNTPTVYRTDYARYSIDGANISAWTTTATSSSIRFLVCEITEKLVGKTVTISGTYTGDEPQASKYKLRACDNADLSGNGGTDVAPYSSPTATITSDLVGKYLAVCVYAPTSTGKTTVYHNIQVEFGTATAYEPYDGQTITLTFGQTVYAGTLTALGGGMWKIQPTHAALTLNGSESWAAYASGNGYRLSVSGMASGEAQTGWADWLATVPNLASLGIEFGRNDTRIYAAQANTIPSVTDLASWQTYLGTHPLTILYPLATLPDPITITGEDLQTLLGANTVWLDCGSVTGMTYRADTALYIQKLLNGGTLQTLSMASPSPSLSLGRVGVLAEPEEAEPEQTEEVGEQPEESEEE